MHLTAPAAARQLDIGLTILRAVTGLIFAVHGAQKLFVFGLDGVVADFTQMGVPLAAVAGPTVALLELFGGLALVVGLLTRLAALGLAADMLGAILMVHLPAGFFLPDGYEFVLALLGAAATLVATGAGRWSVDAVLANRRRSGRFDSRELRRAA